MSHEQIASSEFNEQEQAVIAALSQHGPESAEFQSVFRAWLSEAESLAAAEVDSSGSPRANIQKEFQVAKMFNAAGVRKGVWDSLEAARTEAYDSGEMDLFAEIESYMDTIDAGAQG